MSEGSPALSAGGQTGIGAELSFKRKKWPPKVVSLSGNAQKGEKQRETAISGRLSVRNHDM